MHRKKVSKHSISKQETWGLRGKEHMDEGLGSSLDWILITIRTWYKYEYLSCNSVLITMDNCNITQYMAGCASWHKRVMMRSYRQAFNSLGSLTVTGSHASLFTSSTTEYLSPFNHCNAAMQSRDFCTYLENLYSHIGGWISFGEVSAWTRIHTLIWAHGAISMRKCPLFYSKRDEAINELHAFSINISKYTVTDYISSLGVRFTLHHVIRSGTSKN